MRAQEGKKRKNLIVELLFYFLKMTERPRPHSFFFFSLTYAFFSRHPLYFPSSKRVGGEWSLRVVSNHKKKNFNLIFWRVTLKKECAFRKIVRRTTHSCICGRMRRAIFRAKRFYTHTRTLHCHPKLLWNHAPHPQKKIHEGQKYFFRIIRDFFTTSLWVGVLFFSFFLKKGGWIESRKGIA